VLKIINKNNKIIITIVSLLVIFLLSGLYISSQSIITPLSSPSFEQYTGIPTIFYWGRVDWFDTQYSSSNIAIIDNYKFITHKFNLKGVDDINCGWGGSYYVEVFKDNILIESIGNKSTCWGGSTGSNYRSTQTSFKDEYISAFFAQEYWYSDYTLYSLKNKYFMQTPDNAFDIRFTPVFHTMSIGSYTPKVYYQGDNVSISIDVINNYHSIDKPYNDDLIIEIETEICQDVWYGEACKTLYAYDTLKQYSNTVKYNIPTDFIVSNLTIKPSVNIYKDLSKSTYTGFNVFPKDIMINLQTKETCYDLLLETTGQERNKGIDVTKCLGFIQIDHKADLEKTIDIIQKPIIIINETTIINETIIEVQVEKIIEVFKINETTIEVEKIVEVVKIIDETPYLKFIIRIFNFIWMTFLIVYLYIRFIKK